MFNRLAAQPRLVDHLKDKVKIVTKNDTKTVVFTDPIYVDSPITFGGSFSTEFTDYEIIASQTIQDWLMRITGYRLVKKWEIH